MYDEGIECQKLIEWYQLGKYNSTSGEQIRAKMSLQRTGKFSSAKKRFRFFYVFVGVVICVVNLPSSYGHDSEIANKETSRERLSLNEICGSLQNETFSVVYDEYGWSLWDNRTAKEKGLYVLFCADDGEKEIKKRIKRKQGRIHGHQLRTGGQGRKRAFSHFSTWSLLTDGRTDRRTDGPTDGQSLL